MRRALLLACGVVACTPRAPAGNQRIELRDDWGRRVALAAPARRIVSLAPATTELTFALGLGDRLVGRTTWCDWPPESRAVTDVGNGIGPNVEAIVAQRPDLVLVYPSEANRQALAQLEAAGIAAAALKQDAIADWQATVRWVARAAGVSARADTVLGAFARELASVRSPTGGPTVFIAVEVNPPMAIGRGSFLSELVTLAGGRNAFDDLGAPSGVVSLESVVARNPDVVLILGTDTTVRDLTSRPGWRAVPAVRAGRVVSVNGSEFSRPSPRLPAAVRVLEAKLAAVRAAR